MLLAHHVTWRVAAHDLEEEVAHGYLRYVAVFAALAAAVVAVSSTRHLVRAVGANEAAKAPPAFMFAIVPVIGFVFQEHLEHLVAARELETDFFLSSPFLVGLVLQLPFALIALVVAHLILRAIRTAARVLRGAGVVPLPLWFLDVRRAPVTENRPAPRRGLASRSAGRAPPVLA